MDGIKFIRLCEKIVTEYTEEHLTAGGEATRFHVFPVWVCKILQNNKGLFGTTLPDDVYFEITYNGDKGEAYLDVYRKKENRVIRVTEAYEG